MNFVLTNEIYAGKVVRGYANLISLEGLRTIMLKIYFRKKKMAAPTNKQDIGSTPKKVYPLGNSCLVCGFSFIQKLVDSDGNTTIKKYLDKKLRLSVERLKIVKDVCNITNDVIFTSDTGVCQIRIASLQQDKQSEIPNRLYSSDSLNFMYWDTS